MENKNIATRSNSGKKEDQDWNDTSMKDEKSSKGSEVALDKSKENSLQKVFEKLLKDIYTAELELVDALPKVIEAAHEEDLEDVLRDHLEDTKRQVKRLEKVFGQLDIETSDAEISEPMSGLIAEANKIIKEFKIGPVRDSALIIVAQKIEHYEIATYGSLRTLADVLYLEAIGDVMDRSLEEEKQADEMLSELAEEINDMACRYNERDYKSQKSSSKS